jgi:hypothetical protein
LLGVVLGHQGPAGAGRGLAAGRHKEGSTVGNKEFHSDVCLFMLL